MGESTALHPPRVSLYDSPMPKRQKGAETDSHRALMLVAYDGLQW